MKILTKTILLLFLSLPVKSQTTPTAPTTDDAVNFINKVCPAFDLDTVWSNGASMHWYFKYIKVVDCKLYWYIFVNSPSNSQYSCYVMNLENIRIKKSIDNQEITFLGNKAGDIDIAVEGGSNGAYDPNGFVRLNNKMAKGNDPNSWKPDSFDLFDILNKNNQLFIDNNYGGRLKKAFEVIIKNCGGGRLKLDQDDKF